MVHLLRLPDLNFPDLSFVQQLALKSNSVIRFQSEDRFYEEEALLLADLVPRPMASTQEEEGKPEEPPKEEEPSGEVLSLKVDKEARVSYTLEIFTTSKENANLLVISLEKYLAKMEANKKLLNLKQEDPAGGGPS